MVFPILNMLSPVALRPHILIPDTLGSKELRNILNNVALQTYFF